MSDNNVRIATLEDLNQIAFNLRDADKEEIYASTGSRLYMSVLKESFKLSEKCFTWTINGKPTMMLGVCDGGVVWAMGTDDMLSQRKYFLETADEYISEFMKGYEKIYNYVYVKNVVHIKWLKRAGFVFSDEPITLKNGEKFIYFSKGV